LAIGSKAVWAKAAQAGRFIPSVNALGFRPLKGSICDEQ